MEQAQGKNIHGGQDRLAAKVVGCWRSGSPLALAPDHDDPSTRVPKRINKFDFGDDPEGENTPIFAHIRKTYPRGGRFDDNLHRIMRRGIPFGLHFDPALGRGHGQDAERCLIFNAHCADLIDHSPDGNHSAGSIRRAGSPARVCVPTTNGAIRFVRAWRQQSLCVRHSLISETRP